MKILFVLEYFHPHIGGVETLFLQLGKALQLKGHEVTVFTNNYNSKLPSKESYEGIQIVRGKYASRYHFTFFAASDLRKLNLAFDIIHTTSYNAGIPALIFGRKTNTQVLITFHEVWNRLWFKLPYLNWVERIGFYAFEQLLLRLPFKRFVAVSSYTAECLKQNGIEPKKISMIYNGLELNEISFESVAKSADNFKLIYFGRLGVSKGIDILLDGFALAFSKNKSLRLSLVVPSEPSFLRNKLDNQIKKLRLNDAVEVIGQQSQAELTTTLKQHHAAIIPSYSEGFCYAAAECAFLNVPVISSHQGALKETVSGQYISMKAMNASALCDAILQAYDSNWDYSEPKYFNIEDTVKQYIKLYQTL